VVKVAQSLVLNSFLEWNSCTIFADCGISIILYSLCQPWWFSSFSAIAPIPRRRRNCLWSCSFPFPYTRGGQVAVRGAHVARHGVFGGSRKHSGKTHQAWNFLELITVNLSVQANLNRDSLLSLMEQHFSTWGREVFQGTEGF